MKHFLYLFILLHLLACTGTRQLSYNKEQYRNFTEEEQSMILSADAETPMRVFLITNKADSILLRTDSQPIKVKPKNKVLKHFVQRLHRTVTDSMSLGVGIAAPQVGILKDIIWVQRLDKDNIPWEVYLNPKIKQYSQMKQPCREGCLSIPDRRDTTRTRAYSILVEYDRPDGSHDMEMVEGFTAVIFQHEIDHLNGILYIDHLKQEMAEAQR